MRKKKQNNFNIKFSNEKKKEKLGKTNIGNNK